MQTTTAFRRFRACSECDLVCALPILRPGEQAACPRCGHILARRHLHPVQRSIALASSALFCLLLAALFPFIGMDTGGIFSQMQLPQTAAAMLHQHQPLVALIVSFTIIVLPALYLIGIIAMQAGMLRHISRQQGDRFARIFSSLHPWMMADVFVVAALVSLVKLVGMADVTLGISFWAYCLFAILLLMTTRSIDTDWLWYRLAGEPVPPAGLRSGLTAAQQSMAGCQTCGLVNQVSQSEHNLCQRCGSTLHQRQPRSLQTTWAWLLAAMVLYIPANIYPIMLTTSFGQTQANTIMGGIIDLWLRDSQPIAVIIFVTSILVPVAKMAALVCLTWSVKHGYHRSLAHASRLYRLTELVGRWSMVDVFVVAILVALIQSGNLMSVTPGPAALAFCSVVILTMLAAMNFDPRLIWDSQHTHEPAITDNPPATWPDAVPATRNPA